MNRRDLSLGFHSKFQDCPSAYFPKDGYSVTKSTCHTLGKHTTKHALRWTCETVSKSRQHCTHDLVEHQVKPWDASRGSWLTWNVLESQHVTGRCKGKHAPFWELACRHCDPALVMLNLSLRPAIVHGTACFPDAAKPSCPPVLGSVSKNMEGKFEIKDWNSLFRINRVYANMSLKTLVDIWDKKVLEEGSEILLLFFQFYFLKEFSGSMWHGVSSTLPKITRCIHPQETDLSNKTFRLFIV